MRIWYRVGRWMPVLPPAWSFVVLVLLCLIFDAPRFFSARLADADVLKSMGMIGDRLEIYSAVPIVVAAGIYGCWRVAGFSPLFRPAYAKWLELTPWTSRDPLPLGPLQLGWQDLLIPGLLMASCGVHPSIPRWFVPLVPTVFVVAYAVVATLQILITQQWLYGYLILFGTGWLLLSVAWHLLWIVGVALLAILVVIRFGISASLAAFPWEASVNLTNLTANIARRSTKSGGWPFDILQPNPQPFRVPPVHGLLIALLGGWWIFGILVATVGWGEPIADAYWVPVFVAVLMAAIRTLIYKLPYAPPITWHARLWTGRWIIPGHDRIFVPQAIAIAVAVLGFYSIQRVAPLVWIPISVTISLGCGLMMGPTLKEWMLIGEHRARDLSWYNAAESRRL